MIVAEKEEVANDRISLNDAVSLDIPELMLTKMLIQANSGGGKTYLVRRMLEQSHGKIQHMIVDIEGGLRTLREKYEYIILGDPSIGADYLITPENAGQLAQMFLRFRTSIILHLGAFPESVRQEIVRNFIESLMASPEELWHSVLVVIDEAHKFCPQSVVTPASAAIKDLCSRGRYRGFCACLATQRVTKVDNDALAELNNKCFGRASLKADRERSNEELNLPIKSKTLVTLPAGTFYGFGPAFLPSHEVQEILVGPVSTTHPAPGSQIKSLPPPESMKDVLEALRSLPSSASSEQEEPATSHGRGEHEQRGKGSTTRQVQSVARPNDVPSLQAQNTALMQQNELLQRKIAEQEVQIAALLEVTSPEQQMRAERVQAATVNIGYAEIHQFNSGVAVQEQVSRKESPSPVSVMAVEEGQVSLTQSQWNTLSTVKAKLKKLTEFEWHILHVLLDNDEEAFSRDQLSSLVGMTKSAFAKNAEKTNNVRQLRSLPFVSVYTERGGYRYVSKFERFFREYDKRVVREEFGLVRSEVMTQA